MAGESAHRPLLSQKSFAVDVEFRGHHLDCNRAVKGELDALVHDAEAAAADLDGVVEADGTQLRDDGSSDVALRPERFAVHHCSMLLRNRLITDYLRWDRA